MNFIKLTSYNSYDVYLRTSSITTLRVFNEGGTEIYSDGRLFIVKETPEQILSLIHPKQCIVAGD